MFDRLAMRSSAVFVALAMAALMGGLGLAGCKKGSPGGETVPPPPRELVEKSLRGGKAPIAPPPPGPAGAATR